MAWLSVWRLEQGATDLHYGPAGATATLSSRAPVKSRMRGLPFWCRLTQLVLEKRSLNGCSK